MKKFSLYSLLTVFALLTASNAYAYDLEVDGIYYNLDMTNYTATVTYGDNKYAGDIVVPSTIQYKTAKFDVVKIGGSAFEDLTLDELIVEDGDDEVSVFYWPFYGTSTKTLYIGRPIPLNANFKNNETQTLILGPQLNKWYNSYTGTGVTKVISKIENPSQLAPVFDAITYLDAELIVPNGTLELYKADENWKKFLSISEEGTGTGINSINAANAEGTQTFTLSGIRTSANSKGISIIRENGKTKKVVR